MQSIYVEIPSGVRYPRYAGDVPTLSRYLLAEPIGVRAAAPR